MVNDIGVLVTQTLPSALEWEPGGKKWPTNPPDFTLVDDANQDRVFSSVLTELMKKSAEFENNEAYKNFCVAVIDFNTQPLQYAYYNPFAPAKIWSMAKLAILYAAFQLREDINAIVRAKQRISKAQDLKDELSQGWNNSTSSYLRQIYESAQHIALDYIFDLSKLGTAGNKEINFLGIAQCGLKGLHELAEGEKKNIMNRLQRLPHGCSTPENWREIEKLFFGERLWMTAAWSDNVAASSCLMDLTLPYIQALLYESNLFDGQNGLYFKRNWHPSPPRKHGTRFKPSFGKKEWLPTDDRPTFSGTAYRLTGLMTALAQDKLISERASQEMKNLLRPVGLYKRMVPLRDKCRPPNPNPQEEKKEGPGYYGTPTLILDAVKDESLPIRDAIMKGGLYLGSVSDWAYFELENNKKYGLIILNVKGKDKDVASRLLFDFAGLAWETFKDL